mmetsp:Transcript_30399/g.27647  ORF Transcript_30399/g.27647 Transcript_30399/m.27647 type:complete len:209 (-) Transcript_30399:324-950(-)|eukprot:CAMPEP_0114594446 /NCGR_PEP_ID=MMETSP0125-20121206/16102_1 /TAXON_ID=485358 ORGANISM="Aristerostoma sp., Strain ATCC 50986" /NCGR_SAMPLE_ID=MMETSP0125 /ASSEMBLY_ACC=CAM_ASM_000245 /LENGTH=208 /DNA_ID=CAMNT_0001794757 /DNA_START=379 /DNA_END=1005 /DNA_ORIENTATION=+
MMEYAPYPDLATLGKYIQFGKDEKMVRTLFTHIILGLEYMHSKGIAHLDVKAENIVLGGDFNLKLIDFDFALKIGEGESVGKGTPNYRGPEVRAGETPNPQGADVYSAAIVLFVIKTGIIPYLEDRKIEGVNLQEALWDEPSKFWDTHKAMDPKNFKISSGFRAIFEGMTKKNPNDRMTFAQIKKDPWFTQPIYGPKELKFILGQYFE